MVLLASAAGVFRADVGVVVIISTSRDVTVAVVSTTFAVAQYLSYKDSILVTSSVQF